MKREGGEFRRWQDEARIRPGEKPVEKTKHFASEAGSGLRDLLAGVYVVPCALLAGPGATSRPSPDYWRGRHLPLSDLLEVVRRIP